MQNFRMECRPKENPYTYSQWEVAILLLVRSSPINLIPGIVEEENDEISIHITSNWILSRRVNFTSGNRCVYSDMGADTTCEPDQERT
jgi:hypothetical protein